MKQNSDRNDKANICNKERPQEGNDRRNEQILITGFTRKQNMQTLDWQC